jgi:Flp pilus assembly protein TadG
MRVQTARRRARQATIGRRHGRETGQGLVEFALVFPLFILLTLFIIEFAFVFSALLGVNYASRNGALIAAEAGNDPLADCVILQQVEGSIGAPGNKASIQTVRIYRTDQVGTSLATLLYTRSGATTCTKGAVSLVVPYSSCNGALISAGVASPCPGGTYTYAARCNVLAGCFGHAIDTIGVEITYNHTWVTPIRNFGAAGTGATLVQQNAMRMEPIL